MDLTNEQIFIAKLNATHSAYHCILMQSFVDIHGFVNLRLMRCLLSYNGSRSIRRLAREIRSPLTEGSGNYQVQLRDYEIFRTLTVNTTNKPDSEYFSRVSLCLEKELQYLYKCAQSSLTNKIIAKRTLKNNDCRDQAASMLRLIQKEVSARQQQQQQQKQRHQWQRER